MTEEEERHADEVNIAFQMGAEWQKERSEAAWKGIHEGAVAAMQARIERLESALRRISNVTERWQDSLVSQVNEIAHDALEGKDE